MTRLGLKNIGSSGIDRIVFSLPDYCFREPFALVRHFQLLPRTHELRRAITSIQGKFGHVIISLNLDHYRAAGETVPMSMLRLVDNLQKEFDEHFDLRAAKIVILELHRDIFTNNSYSDYRRILGSISLSGMRRRWCNGSTFYAGNKLFQLKIYDKGSETKIPKYKNLLRMEFTIKRQSRRLNTLQIRTVHELLKNFYLFESALFSQLQENFKRLTRRPIRKILPAESTQSIIEELWLRNKIHADEANVWIVAYASGNLNWEDVEKVIRATYALRINTRSRRLARARGIFESLQLLRPSSRLIDHTFLCGELQQKFSAGTRRCYDLQNPYDFEEVLQQTRNRANNAARII